MRAAVFREAGRPLAVEVLDDPRPTPGQVVVKVCRCGVCGTDLSMTSGHGWDYPTGWIPGHEVVGEIVELGSQVEGLRKGDVVTAVPYATCGACEFCVRGAHTMCAGFRGQMGGFSELLAVAGKTVVRLPSTFSAADGALVEPCAVSLNGIRQSALKLGMRVLVLGAGTVGLTTLFWARRLGAHRIVALSRSARRAYMALAMGADAFVASGENEVQEVIEALGGPPDIVYECVGAPGLLAQALQHVAPCGQIVSLGFCTSPDAVIPALAASKAVQLIFPVGYTVRDFEYAADQMLAGAIDPKVMVTSEIPLDELPTVFEQLRGPNAETKVHVTMGAS